MKNELIKTILVIYLILMVPNSLAADVIISTPNATIQIGQTFNININIDPLMMPVSGAQLNIKYNQSVLKVNKVLEGNFFKQEGAKTYFHSGVLNNSTGIVANIFSVILGPSNVSRYGTFLIINATAIGSSNISWINLSNVKISDPKGISVSLKSKNGTLNISKIIWSTGGNTRTLDIHDGYINGTVRSNGKVVSGVIVTTNASGPKTTDVSGFYSLRIPTGTHNLIATREPAYFPKSSIVVSATSGTTVIQDIELDMKPLGTISGSVRSFSVRWI